MTTATQTEIVLADMLTENTGRHMLDSGGAYGRNWERNQGRDVQAFLQAPAVRLTHDYVTIDLFHWLRDRLEYDPTMDRKLELWNALYLADEPWLAVMESFAAKVSTGDADADPTGYLAGTVNSYNHEESLSQTIQFTLFDDEEGDNYCLLQIHGGADVRGGYTRPRAFRLTCDVEYMFDFDNYTVVCTAPAPAKALPGTPEPGQHILDARNGEWTTYEGSFERDPWNGENWTSSDDKGNEFIRCPYCIDPTPMTVEPAVVS